MLRTVFLNSLLLFGTLGLFFSSWLLWLNDSLDVKINNDAENYINNNSNVEHYSFLLSSPIKNFLKQSISNPNADNDFSLKLLNEYLKENPLDANVWIIGSQLHQRASDFEAASKNLMVAYRLSKTNTPILFKVFNRYLELGLIESALPVAHDLVLAKPDEFRRIFYLMSRLTDNYSLLVDTMIPKKESFVRLTKKQFSPDQYFYWALGDAVRTKNNELASVVWGVMPAELKSSNKFGLLYINYLVESQRPDLLKPVWNDVVGTEIEVSQLLNSGYSSLSPCWHIRQNEAVSVNLDGDQGKLLMKIDFLGERNVNYNHLSCLVYVLPGKKYNLSGYFKGDDITTLSGPFMDVVFPGIKSRYFKSDAAIGTWPWTGFGITFDVPEGAHFAKIRVRRKKTQLLDSKISGSVWFKNIRLEPFLDLVEGPLSKSF